MSRLLVPKSAGDPHAEYRAQAFRAFARPDGMRVAMRVPLLKLADRWAAEAVGSPFPYHQRLMELAGALQQRAMELVP